MNKENFIIGIKNMRDSCVESRIRSLQKPAGRKPRKSLVESSLFYHSLNDINKENLRKIMADAIDQALFSFLCILDHVGFIEDTEEKSEFELYAIKNGERILINDPQQEELHNLYNDLTLDKD
jgi:hypothetical protein